MGLDLSPCSWCPGLHLVEPTVDWLTGSSLVPSWASVASDNPSEPPVRGCVVGKLARWLGAGGVFVVFCDVAVDACHRLSL